MAASRNTFWLLVGQARFLVHSNHFLCPEYACDANWQLSLPNSFPRLDRMRTRIDEKFASIRLEDRAAISRRSRRPSRPHLPPFARRPERSDAGQLRQTVAALIAGPEQRRLHIARSNPCENPFVTYSLA